MQTETGKERIGKNRTYKCSECGAQFSLFLVDPLPRKRRVCMKCKNMIKVVVEIPAEKAAGILVCPDFQGAPLVSLSFLAQKALAKKLGFDGEVESELEASLPRGWRYRGMLEAVDQWVKQRLEDMETEEVIEREAKMGSQYGTYSEGEDRVFNG